MPRRLLFVALTSLDIRASISGDAKHFSRFSTNSVRKLDRLLERLTVLKNCNGCAKAQRFAETPNSLIYMWITEERGIHQVRVPPWHCRSHGKLAGMSRSRSCLSIEGYGINDQ